MEFAPLVDADTVTTIVRQRPQETTRGYAISRVANTGAGAGSCAYVIIQLLSE